MNTLYKILFAGFILLGSYPSVYAQDDVLNKFATNLKSGNTQGMVSFLNEKVEISIDGQTSSVSKAESANMIKTFLSKHPVSAFTYKHKGSSGSAGYAIASMVSNGQNYRIMIRVKDNAIEKIDFKPE